MEKGEVRKAKNIETIKNNGKGGEGHANRKQAFAFVRYVYCSNIDDAAKQNKSREGGLNKIT